jgi:hypothetical protein
LLLEKLQGVSTRSPGHARFSYLEMDYWREFHFGSLCCSVRQRRRTIYIEFVWRRCSYAMQDFCLARCKATASPPMSYPGEEGRTTIACAVWGAPSEMCSICSSTAPWRPRFGLSHFLMLSYCHVSCRCRASRSLNG